MGEWRVSAAAQQEVAAVAPAAAPAASRRILGDGMSVVDGLAAAYLALPVALFFFTWFRPVYAIPFGLAALAGLLHLRGLRPRPEAERSLAVAFFVALAWVTLGGAGHFVYANYFDWHMRDAVLRDLAAMPAPATYRIQDGAAAILRAPIGYYVLPALLARLLGLREALWILHLWTLAGVVLFLMQVLAGERRWGAIACILALVIFFSGMDAWEVSRRALLNPTSYKEWWAYPYFAYDSNTTALFWAPNHLLPAWLGIGLVYRCRDDPRFLGIAAWVGALTLLWSPLASVGLLPFFLLIAWRALRRGKARALFSACNLIAAPLVGLPVAIYITAASGTIHAVGTPAEAGLAGYAKIYLLFVLIEFLILALALLRAHREGIDPPFFWLAVVVLLLLPLYRFGPVSDLATRASAPALMVLMFAAADGWARPLRLGGRGLLVTAVLLIGALTPLSEIGRALLWPPWQLDLQRTVWEESAGGHSPNYLAEMPADSLLARLLREPAAPRQP